MRMASDHSSSSTRGGKSSLLSLLNLGEESEDEAPVQRATTQRHAASLLEEEDSSDEDDQTRLPSNNEDPETPVESTKRLKRASADLLKLVTLDVDDIDEQDRMKKLKRTSPAPTRTNFRKTNPKPKAVEGIKARTDDEEEIVLPASYSPPKRSEEEGQEATSDSQSLSFSNSEPRSGYHKRRITKWNEQYDGLGTRLNEFVRVLETLRNQKDKFVCLMCGNGPFQASLSSIATHLESQCLRQRVLPEEMNKVNNKLVELREFFDSTANPATARLKKLQRDHAAHQSNERRARLKNRIRELFLETGMDRSSKNIRLVRTFTNELIEMVNEVGLRTSDVSELDVVQLERMTKRNKDR